MPGFSGPFGPKRLTLLVATVFGGPDQNRAFSPFGLAFGCIDVDFWGTWFFETGVLNLFEI